MEHAGRLFECGAQQPSSASEGARTLNLLSQRSTTGGYRTRHLHKSSQSFLRSLSLYEQLLGTFTMMFKG
jgi:hypothetical protein